MYLWSCAAVFAHMQTLSRVGLLDGAQEADPSYLLTGGRVRLYPRSILSAVVGKRFVQSGYIELDFRKSSL